MAFIRRSLRGKSKDKWKKELNRNWVFLKTNIIMDVGFLQELRSRHVVKEEEYSIIKRLASPLDQKEELLQVIERSTYERFEGFVEALMVTNQKYVSEKLRRAVKRGGSTYNNRASLQDSGSFDSLEVSYSEPVNPKDQRIMSLKEEKSKLEMDLEIIHMTKTREIDTVKMEIQSHKDSMSQLEGKSLMDLQELRDHISELLAEREMQVGAMATKITELKYNPQGDMMDDLGSNVEGSVMETGNKPLGGTNDGDIEMEEESYMIKTKRLQEMEKRTEEIKDEILDLEKEKNRINAQLFDVAYSVDNAKSSLQTLASKKRKLEEEFEKENRKGQEEIYRIDRRIKEEEEEKGNPLFNDHTLFNQESETDLNKNNTRSVMKKIKEFERKMRELKSTSFHTRSTNMDDIHVEEKIQEYEKQIEQLRNSSGLSLIIPSEKPPSRMYASENDLLNQSEETELPELSDSFTKAFRGSLKVLSPITTLGSRSPLLSRIRPRLLVLGGVPDRFDAEKYVEDPTFIRSQVDVVPLDDAPLSPKSPTRSLDMPCPLFKATVVVTSNGKNKPYVYVMGGADVVRRDGSVDAKKTLFRLDPKQGKWKQRADMLIERCDAVSFEVKKGFVVAGGWNRKDGTISSVELYNTKSGHWEKKGKLPYPLDLAASCQLQGVGYIIGGRRGDVIESNDTSSDVIMYYLSLDYWRLVERVLTPGRRGHSVCTDGSNIYIFGGDDGEYLLSTLDMYTPETGHVTHLKDMPCARVATSAVYFRGIIYLAGGAGNTMDDPDQVVTSDTVMKYNVDAGHWELPDTWLPRKVDWACAVIVNI